MRKSKTVQKKNNKASIFGYKVAIVVILCAIAVILFLVFTNLVFKNSLSYFDSRLIELVYNSRTPELTRFSFFITAFGSSLFFFTASIVVAAFLYFKNKIDSLIFIVIIFSAVIINIFLKSFYSRPRPGLDSLIIENSYSYPSFHAMSSFVLYSAIAFIIYKSTKNRNFSIIISILFGLLILLIGLSRIYLGVHYPSDVIAGYLGGFIWILVLIIFQRTIIFERLYNKSIKK